MKQQQNVIFWGAGATAALGIRTTAQQELFIRHITGVHTTGKSLEKRIAEALGQDVPERWHAALFDLITILGDGDEAYDSINVINDQQLEAMRRNWHQAANDEELRRRIIELRLVYDWPALKAVVSACPGSSTGKFKLNDLFNLLDMHILPGAGFRAPLRHGTSDTQNQSGQFLDARRLIGAKNALLMILIASFYIDYRECIRSKRALLKKYSDFAFLLARRTQDRGLELARQDDRLDQPRFYKGDVSFVSINYDPIALWVQFNANRELNQSASVPHIGSPSVPLQVFNDFGHLIPARRIGKGDAGWPWYAMNEAAVQRINEQRASDFRVRLTKFLFPHGCLCWRECPDCGKLSTYHGDHWGLDARGLFPPPPLRAFDDEPCPDWIKGEERTQREKGKVDARGCLHCGTLTYAHHTQAVMQSSFKPRPPSFIEEIQRDLRATTMQADHIIFMGYSLPPDDVTYRAFFSARRQRNEGARGEVRCTVVDKCDDYPAWYGPTELNTMMERFPEVHPVKAARDIFGDDNVRFYGGGVPNVFLDGDQATDAALERLLNWT
jgi:hypothetical protein